jgi:lysophospholipase
VSNCSAFNSKDNSENNRQDPLNYFWNKGLFNSFSGVDDVSVHYAQFMQEEVALHTIVVVPGRCESYLKYQELAFDLYNQGYNIFIIDHRGQGFSGRLLPNLHKGYVNKFQDYVEDLQYFIEKIVNQYTSEKPYLLAHSMGGAIATRYMQESPNAIKAAVISSPMLGFDSGIFPHNIAKSLIAATLFFNKITRNNPWYFLGQKNYSPTNFTDNKLTHSSGRYQQFTELYKNNKNIQLGGVTSHWLAQSIIAQKDIFAKLSQLKTPILLLQAGADIVVCQQAQNDFCLQLHAIHPQSCPNGLPSRVDGAFHELFFEIDGYRDRAIAESLAWFQQHN